MVMKYPAEMLKKQQHEKTTILVLDHHNTFYTIFRAVHALNTQITKSLHTLSFYRGSVQQQQPALCFYPQHQSIIVTYLDAALYSATENTFLLKVYFSSIEYVFPSMQHFVHNLLCLLVSFLVEQLSPSTHFILNNIFP